MTYQGKEQIVEIIEDKKNEDKQSENSEYHFNLDISSKNQNIHISQNIGNLSQDEVFLGNKREAEMNLFDDIIEAENPLDLSKRINPQSNLNCNNIYLIINLFNKYIAFMPYDNEEIDIDDVISKGDSKESLIIQKQRELASLKEMVSKKERELAELIAQKEDELKKREQKISQNEDVLAKGEKKLRNPEEKK